MREVILAIVLIALAIFDLKYKEIPLLPVAIGGCIGAVFCFMEEQNIMVVIAACLPGIMMLVFSRLAGEVMGYGDGIVLLLMGVFVTLDKILFITCIAFCFAGGVALILFVFFQKKGKYRLPFIPFLCASYLLDWLCEISGGVG